MSSAEGEQEGAEGSHCRRLARPQEYGRRLDRELRRLRRAQRRVSRRLARHVAGAAWAEIRCQLTYKAQRTAAGTGELRRELPDGSGVRAHLET